MGMKWLPLWSRSSVQALRQMHDNTGPSALGGRYRDAHCVTGASVLGGRFAFHRRETGSEEGNALLRSPPSEAAGPELRGGLSGSGTKVLFTEMVVLDARQPICSRSDQKSCLKAGQFEPHLEKWVDLALKA